ncbi:MAG: hypothetical protein EOM84_01280 [Sphingobacteriia bacterium]|nr:hypothetical protein [Sphingobacteriia bacterium]
MKKIGAVICFKFTGMIFLIFPFWAGAQYATPTGTQLPGGDLTEIIIGIMQWILVILGAIGVIGFVIAGIIYLTSAGDDNRIGTAKKAMLYSIIGVIVGIMGYVIIQAVNSMLDGGASF